ncbi:MAG: UDP-glucose dehydrogenase family protein, partial [Polyangiales bacterium]
ERKIAELRSGAIPIFEPGLEDLVNRNAASGRLQFETDLHVGLADADAVFIAVGTPPRSDGAADLSAVDAVAAEVATRVTRPTVLVLKSTVPVGTNARVRRIVKGAAQPVYVVSNPEFLKEGDAVNDFLRPDRIVVGIDPQDEHSRDLMGRLYHPLCLDRDRMVWMDPASAELTKYVANTMLAMRVSFMNEIATLCEKVGADVHRVRVGVGSDTRIGTKFLYAGPGYGGSCFPKDVSALVHTGRDHGVELELAATTDRVNQRQRGLLFRKLKRHFDGFLRGKRIAVWGLSFKPRTDDIRESPALTLVDALLADGAIVVGHDPAAAHAVAAQYGKAVELAADAYEAARGADALVLVTEWREYQNPDFARLHATMNERYLLDGRNVWSDYRLRQQGFIYEGVGVQGS